MTECSFLKIFWHQALNDHERAESSPAASRKRAWPEETYHSSDGVEDSSVLKDLFKRVADLVEMEKSSVLKILFPSELPQVAIKEDVWEQLPVIRSKWTKSNDRNQFPQNFK